MSALASALLSAMMLAVFALTAGGAYTLLRRDNRMQGVLMLVAAAVLLVNVLIWTIPG